MPTPAELHDLGDRLVTVWQQARENHARHSATGSQEADIRFMALGLTGEAGEVMDALLQAAGLVSAAGKVANLVKKRWRDGDGHDEALRFEVADVFAYTIMLADLLGMTPGDLIDTAAHKQQVFLEKMAARANQEAA